MASSRLHQRRSMRLKDYDYRRAGAYFLTLCTQDRRTRFGAIRDGQMVLNAAGRMILGVWNGIPCFYPGVTTDAFVVMPDHIHGIVILSPVEPIAATGVHDTPTPHPRTIDGAPAGATPRGCPEPPTNTNAWNAGRPGQARGPAPAGIPAGMSVGDVVHRFKSLTTRRYADAVHRLGWPSFARRLWQRNYHERIIRDEQALHRIREYIRLNPARWPSKSP